MDIDMLIRLCFLSFCAWMIFTLAKRYPQPLPAKSWLQTLLSMPSRITQNKFLQFLMILVTVMGTFALVSYALLWVFQRVDGVVMIKDLYVGALAIICWNLFAKVAREIRHTKSRKIITFLAPFAALALSALWLVMPVWVVYDFIAILAGYAILSAVPELSPIQLIAVLAGVVLYDLWGVYGSIHGAPGVIVQLATRMTFTPPVVILVPDVHNLVGYSSDGLLGLGDIILPGMVLIASIKYGRFNQIFLGWVIGLFVALFIGVLTRAPVPATITLVPGTIIPLLFNNPRWLAT